MVEDGLHGGKGRMRTQPLSSATPSATRSRTPPGPSINPLIKVMNLVAVLVVPAVVKLTIGHNASVAWRLLLGLAAVAIIAAAIGSVSEPSSGLDGRCPGCRYPGCGRPACRHPACHRLSPRSHPSSNTTFLRWLPVTSPTIGNQRGNSVAGLHRSDAWDGGGRQ